MNDFLKDLFVCASKKQPESLAAYEDEDLNNFFDESNDDPKSRLIELAAYILENLENSSSINDYCRKSGLSSKSQEKVIGYVKKNKSELASTKKFGYVECDGRYLGMSWAIRSVFFSKKEEFKNQKKYAVMNIDVKKNEGKEKIVLSCSKESVLKIRGKLEKLDKEIRDLFGGETKNE